MRRLAPKELKLEEKEREYLKKLINRHTTEQQIALRAKIVLLADEGENNREIARKSKISRKMASQWRERWIAGQAKGSNSKFKWYKQKQNGIRI